MMTTTTKMSRRKKPRLKSLFAISAAFSCALVSASARASLTTSEANQVREFYAAAKPADAPQARALVARPDLTPEESASVLSTAVGGVAFTPQRAAFLKALIFGGASLPSRSVVVLATTQAVLARANEVIAKVEGDFDAHADAVSEVQRIFVFLDQEIASAAVRRGVGGPPESGISPATYDDCTKAIADASALHPKWLKVDAKLSLAAEKVRAQEQLALFDMMNESPTFRIDAADKLGLVGARRTFFLELGVLILDDGKASDARVNAARSLFLRLPAARAGVEAVFFGDEKPDLVGGGAKKKEIIAVKSPLDPLPSAAAVDLVPADLQGTMPSSYGAKIDPALGDLAHDLSAITVQRALQNRGDLALQATRDAKTAIDKQMPLGKPLPQTPAPDANAILAQAVELLAIDLHAAFQMASLRYKSVSNVPAALFSDAVGILAVYAPPSQIGSGLSLAVGRSTADATTETVLATNVGLAPNGAATSLTLGRTTFEIIRDPSGEVTNVLAILRGPPPPDAK
jgi:hypothetical protein